MAVDAFGQEHARAAATARIVSLVPSITELLFDLDLGPQVVGRTGFCVHPRSEVRKLTKIGGTKDVNLDAIRALAPSHAIVNIDENNRETFDALNAFVPHVIVTHPNAPRDNLDLYHLLGDIFDRVEAARRLARDFEAALASIERTCESLSAKRVLYLIWRKPWMTVSKDTYISRTLALVNWETLPRDSAARYPSLSDDDIRELPIDLCLLSSEPYAFRDKHLDEVGRLVGARENVRLIDGELLSWYGSRAIEGIDYLARFAAASSEAEP
ncbi:MAG: helical backbone metal receptor [Pseudomonadota bacterium]|nr:helical backbone metal receptor [Pseudomonadota bacterium]